MVRDLLKIYIPLLIIISFICGLIYFFYPVMRYEYQQHGDTRIIVRIDRFNGDVDRLTISPSSQKQGWNEVSKSK